MAPLRVFTWHVHGNYLYYLSQTEHEFIVPVDEQRRPPYVGRGTTFDFGPNVREVPVGEVRNHSFDCVLHQSRDSWERDQYEILSEEQRRLPQIYLEHDPPREHPTDTRHPVQDGDTLLVHVTHFNALMWDSGITPTRVVEHGVMLPPGVRYSGEIPRGIAVVNNLPRRGRRLGADIFEQAREVVPIDLVGMGAEEASGLGEVPPMELAAFEARYRFFFHPIRYTSLGLAVCEAMMLGMPVVGLATTELSTVIENGRSGYISTNPADLHDAMRLLLDDPDHARKIGERGRAVAEDRFNIRRFADDWNEVFAGVAGRRTPTPAPSVPAGGS